MCPLIAVLQIKSQDFDQLRLQSGEHTSILELKDSIIERGEALNSLTRGVVRHSMA